MKRILTITFHRAHNFGSVLQAYALQESLKRLCDNASVAADCRVIDFNLQVQDELYSVFKSGKGLKSMAKNLLTLPYKKQLEAKHKKFDNFVANRLSLSQRYIAESELRANPPVADYYISGSDQIWNVRAKDFSKAYLLDFVHSGKRISYAASCGPLKIDWSLYDFEGIAKLLDKYDLCSVRENGSVENLQTLTSKTLSVHLDPTLLIDSEEWRKIQSRANYHNGQYVLLYCLEPTKEQLLLANMIAKKLKLPILVLRYNNKNDMFNHFVKRYDAGPEDFLAYIDHAALVLTSSFHGTVFSLLYKKPFYVFDGMMDNRISSLLSGVGMEERAISQLQSVENINTLPLEYQTVEHYLAQKRFESFTYLADALELKV